MAVGGPLVISRNVAPLKWRPFSSCFNVSQLLQRNIRLLSIAYLFAWNICIWAMTVLTVHAWIRLLSHDVSANNGDTARQRTHALKQKTQKTGTFGGNDMHCLFNRMLWNDSVIMLSSARLSVAKWGCHSLLSDHNSTLQVFNGQKDKRVLSFPPVLHLYSLIFITNMAAWTLRLGGFFWSSHLKPVWQALCVNS